MNYDLTIFTELYKINTLTGTAHVSIWKGHNGNKLKVMANATFPFRKSFPL